jgi:hypothetical protein
MRRGRTHRFPKFPKSLDALLGRVTRDERGIDGANRISRDPVRMEFCFRKSLIGAETPASQEQRNPFERRALFPAMRFPR